MSGVMLVSPACVVGLDYAVSVCVGVDELALAVRWVLDEVVADPVDASAVIDVLLAAAFVLDDIPPLVFGSVAWQTPMIPFWHETSDPDAEKPSDATLGSEMAVFAALPDSAYRRVAPSISVSTRRLGIIIRGRAYVLSVSLMRPSL